MSARAKAGLGLMLAAIPVFAIMGIYSTIDLTLNYVPVEAVTRAVEHRCTAVHYKLFDGKRRKDKEISGGTCDQIRARVAADPALSGSNIVETVYVSLDYRSPVDQRYYTGKLRLGLVEDIAPVGPGEQMKILASIRQTEAIQQCCGLRLDWFDGA